MQQQQQAWRRKKSCSSTCLLLVTIFSTALYQEHYVILVTVKREHFSVCTFLVVVVLLLLAIESTSEDKIRFTFLSLLQFFSGTSLRTNCVYFLSIRCLVRDLIYSLYLIYCNLYEKSVLFCGGLFHFCAEENKLLSK